MCSTDILLYKISLPVFSMRAERKRLRKQLFSLNCNVCLELNGDGTNLYFLNLSIFLRKKTNSVNSDSGDKHKSTGTFKLFHQNMSSLFKFYS